MNTRFAAIALALMVAVTGCKKRDTAATLRHRPRQPASGCRRASPLVPSRRTDREAVPAQLPDVVAAGQRRIGSAVGPPRWPSRRNGVACAKLGAS